MLDLTIAGIAGLVLGAYLVLSFWTIARLASQLRDERLTSATLRADCANLRALVEAMRAERAKLEEERLTLQDVARNALGREAAVLSRPTYLRQEEALMMAQTIGAMIDKSIKN